MPQPARLLLFATLAAALPALAAKRSAAPAPRAAEVHVQGNHLVDGAGKQLQLRGVNLAGLEFTAVQGWSPGNPWGSTHVDFPGILAWGANVVRIPLNEASWFGGDCTDGAGKLRSSDPGHNYQDTVRATVEAASTAGLYVILDLHWNAPAQFCPMAQAPMADAARAPQFWTEVAGAFKSRPNVLFELFNEPFMDWLARGQDPWQVLRDGGTQTQYTTATQGRWQASYTWQSAGMQQLLDAVRATGARNVVLVGGLGYSRDLRGWLSFRPRDPLGQLGAVWHAYPKSATVGSPDAAIPLNGATDYAVAEAILGAGFPLLITETGDHNAPGTVGAPFVSKLLPWADRVGASYLGWTWNAWGQPDHVLLKDNSGRPSDGYGEYFRAHLVCMASATAPCP